MAEPKFLTLSKASLLLGLSPRTLLIWCGNGTIPAYRPNPKGVYLVDIAEVEAAIKAKAAHEREATGLTKERAREITDRVVAESRARMAAKKKTLLQHGETIH